MKTSRYRRNVKQQRHNALHALCQALGRDNSACMADIDVQVHRQRIALQGEQRSCMTCKQGMVAAPV